MQIPSTHCLMIQFVSLNKGSIVIYNLRETNLWISYPHKLQIILLGCSLIFIGWVQFSGVPVRVELITQCAFNIQLLQNSLDWWLEVLATFIKERVREEASFHDDGDDSDIRSDSCDLGWRRWRGFLTGGSLCYGLDVFGYGGDSFLWLGLLGLNRHLPSCVNGLPCCGGHGRALYLLLLFNFGLLDADRHWWLWRL